MDHERFINHIESPSIKIRKQKTPGRLHMGKTDGGPNSTIFFLKLLYPKHGTSWSVKYI